MTILCNGCVAGSILKFEQVGNPEVSYWIGKQFWGKGIATCALIHFLPNIKVRPLYARAARITLHPSGCWKNADLKETMRTKDIPMQEAKRLKNSF